MSNTLLRMSGIDKAFGGATALRAAELEIGIGEVHAVIGQNGAGKSTLIKILTGVYRRDGGDIQFDGAAADFRSPRDAQAAGISPIYQELNLIALRTVAENICLGYEPRKWGMVSWRRANQMARDVLARFDIHIDVTRPLGEYNTAIQQLVAIARAMSLDVKLLIMDEPTSSLDDREIEVLFNAIRALNNSGVSVLYVTHFLDELFSICHRVSVMRDGRTVGRHRIADTSKLELVSEMLGRDVNDIRSAGMTQFAANREESSAATGDVLLAAQNIATESRLRDLSLTLHAGEIVGLGGLLGSGRTEAARAIFGVDAITRGSIVVSGMPGAPKSTRAAINDGIGFLTEDRKTEGIVPEMSVRENITLALLPRLSSGGRVDRKKETEIVDRFIERLGIKLSSADQPIRELSGGNQQKALLARWLCTAPRILLLDEPTRGVDIGAKLEIQAIIRGLVEEGVGVILISSEFEELVEGADRITVLRDGVAVAELRNPGITENTLIQAIAQSDAPARAGRTETDT